MILTSTSEYWGCFALVEGMGSTGRPSASVSRLSCALRLSGILLIN